MFLADVLGPVVSPVQHPVLEGERLLLVRPLDPRGERTARTRIALDRASAGVGDRVLVVDEGNAGRQLMNAPNGPVKTVIVGIVDYVEHEGALTFDAGSDGAASG